MDTQPPQAGNTTLQKVDGIFFKCEFENPTGSIKDRAIDAQINHLKQNKIKKATLSSSGNAAISAAYYCQNNKIDLTIFVASSICKEKLQVLKQYLAIIKISKKPISDAQKFSLTNNVYNLRQSKDPYAWEGYASIAYELYKQNNDIDAIFIPLSSGAMFWGIVSGYKKLGKTAAFHAVQTTAIHPLASRFDRDYVKTEKSIADGIVAKTTPLEEKIITSIKESNGWGWVASDDEMEKAHTYLKENDLLCSYEGAASLAALWKAQKKGYSYKNPVVILSGKYYAC